MSRQDRKAATDFKNQQISLVGVAYGQVSALVHFVRSVLAVGFVGAGLIPDCLVVPTAFPDLWDCSRGSARADRRAHNASGADLAQDLMRALSYISFEFFNTFV